ncbi:hypothetical protein AcW1_007811 [Taiwanofungus camphoratus]|nr:hypothetical protein AcV7_005781 [Antrodia cinnamomea]KAI0953642.1 hypothetical protein AcW1_007811 [Antrodia cinnamomea]
MLRPLLRQPFIKSIFTAAYSHLSPRVPAMLKYISPDELAAIIKSAKVPMKDYCVVDVRDDDWYGGNITGAHNSPSHGFLSKVDDLVEQTKTVPMVIFHCALSQVRGPKAASVGGALRSSSVCAVSELIVVRSMRRHVIFSRRRVRISRTRSLSCAVVSKISRQNSRMIPSS